MLNRQIRALITNGNLISHLLGILFDAANFNPNKNKPSLGQKLLPASYRNSRKAITIANIALWIAVVALIAVTVALLS